MNAAVFHVLTEFRFDIGAALLGSETLQGSLNDLSASAFQARSAIMGVGVGFLGTMGLGTTSVLGSLWTMIEASEKFNASQRSLANILASNHMVNSIEDGFLAADDAMTRIKEKAIEFGLPAQTMLNTTKMLSATLSAMPAVADIIAEPIKIQKLTSIELPKSSIPVPAFPKTVSESIAPKTKGLEDASLHRSIDLSRFYLKAAPILGVDPGAYYNQLVDLVMGRGTNNDMFTTRLFADTQALAPYKMQGGMQKFNQLDSHKRIQLLTDALSQFGSNAKIVEANARSLTAQMQVLKDQLYGTFSVFRSIGSSISNIVGQAVYQANQVLAKHGTAISLQLGDFIQAIASSPEEAYLRFHSVENLKRDVKSAAHVMEATALIGSLGGALKSLGIIAKPFGAWVSVTAGAVVALIDIFDRQPMAMAKAAGVTAAAFAAIIAVFMFPVIGTILATGAALTWFFSIFSEARALANIDDFKKTPAQLELFARNLNGLRIAFGRLAAPFSAVKDFIAEHIKFMFSEAMWYDWINDKIFQLVYGLTIVETFIGAILKIPEAIASALAYLTSSDMLKNPKGILSAFMGPIDDITKKIYGENMAPYLDPEAKKPVSQQITNVGNININNQFKEQMEPDRIAFTLMEQIKKTTANPGQARNGSMSFAYAGGR
jgi:hypothetical protein